MTATQASPADITTSIVVGLSQTDSVRLLDAWTLVESIYVEQSVPFSGQNGLQFIQGLVYMLATLHTDAQTRIASLLFELPTFDTRLAQTITTRFGKEIADLVAGVRQLMSFHGLWQQPIACSKNTVQQAAQLEILRKMLLAMAIDMRVVLVRLASHIITLRYFAANKLVNQMTIQYAREVFNLYAPLAHRLGIWQIKWELEDLSFRFLEPHAYKQIANLLEEKRIKREEFVANAKARLHTELAAAGIQAEVTGRPKHIYSIWNKMRSKHLHFSELDDVRALRVIVDDIKTCYAALSMIHHIWSPIPDRFDDYIVRPKQNGYQSLHTVVVAADGRPLEIQIRTHKMHHFAEYGHASHWRYKESGGSSFAAQHYDRKIAWLRQLLAWKSEVTDTVVATEPLLQSDWARNPAILDEHIYVLTPQAHIIELPHGATPIDFAYHLHTSIGHRCRGARIDGVIEPLNTQLKNGQTIEIITIKNTQNAGPSRDWLNPSYVASARARSKIRAWFNVIEREKTLAHGRNILEKTLQREGKTTVKLEDLAHRLGFAKIDDLLLSLGKNELSPRHMEPMLRVNSLEQPHELDDIAIIQKSDTVSAKAQSNILVVGTEGLMTQLARCCKPAPSDAIGGFVTRGKGVSIHRLTCKNFFAMQSKALERIVQTTWGALTKEPIYPVDILVLADNRQGLLRDISHIFLREKMKIVNMRAQNQHGQARMWFTAQISSTAQLQKALLLMSEVQGIVVAKRF